MNNIPILHLVLEIFSSNHPQKTVSGLQLLLTWNYFCSVKTINIIDRFLLNKFLIILGLMYIHIL